MRYSQKSVSPKQPHSDAKTDSGADAMACFHPVTAAWFRAVFDAPTAPQRMGWPVIARGESALILAPTGTGKTLAAFLWCLDRLMLEDRDQPPQRAQIAAGTTAGTEGPRERERRERGCRIVYVSPLKALAVDVERNLRSPLAGMANMARRMGVAFHEPAISVRTGDTPQRERARFARHPADILITTPESLYLLLTSQAAEALRTVETVIVDEIHALVPTKRGAHLSLTLERLEALTARPLQRIGLSATQRPLEEVARFLGGVEVQGTRDQGTEGPRKPPQRRTTGHVEQRSGIRLQRPNRRCLVFLFPWSLGPLFPASALSARDHRQRRRAQATQAAHRGSGGGHGAARRDGGDSLRPGLADAAPRLHLERDPSAAAGDYSRAQLDHSFCERRQIAERLAGALNELAGEPIARAHHGSLAAAQRTVIEEQLKAGQIRALCATSTLELGIDMGAVDLVIQIESPPSVASGMQRIGRAGHHVDAVSEGDSVSQIPRRPRGLRRRNARHARGAHRVHALSAQPAGCAVPAVGGDRCKRGEQGTKGPREQEDREQGSEPPYRAKSPAGDPGREQGSRAAAASLFPDASVPQSLTPLVPQSLNPEVSVDFLFDLVRRAAPFGSLSRTAFEGVLDLLSGRYPSDEFGELRPRLTWDRVRNVVTARDGAARLAILNAGTIPDRGLYGVFLAFTEGKSVRVGELDEEMVFESHPNETFILGASTWRITDITHDRVLVTPAPGEPGKMPFWKGDGPGRPLEFGRRIGAMVRELRALPQAAALTRLVNEHDLDPGAAENLLRFLADQAEATGQVPDDRTIVVERCRDELGDWRVCVLTPFGSRIHIPWAMAVSARIRAAGGPEVETLWGDDGFVLRFPDTDEPPDSDWILVESAEAMQLVLRQLGSTALFAGRFREAAGRALLLPRRRADQRSPLWQLRKRSYDLLSVASRYPSFPLLLEAYRECLRDVFDMPALVETLRAIEQRQLRVHVVETRKPSPFASSLLFSYVANFMYEGDAPLAERRAQALTIDQDQLRELLGEADLRELLDADAIAEVEEAAQCLAENFRARSADGMHDLCLRAWRSFARRIGAALGLCRICSRMSTV